MLFSTQIGVNFYCIRNKRTKDYWSNEIGWIEIKNKKELSSYSVFTTQEKERFNLPVEGYWEKM